MLAHSASFHCLHISIHKKWKFLHFFAISLSMLVFSMILNFYASWRHNFGFINLCYIHMLFIYLFSNMWNSFNLNCHSSNRHEVSNKREKIYVVTWNSNQNLQVELSVLMTMRKLHVCPRSGNYYKFVFHVHLTKNGWLPKHKTFQYVPANIRISVK